MTRDEAAHQLGSPLHTLKNRLEWARNRLRERLTARGVGLLGASIGTVFCEQAASAAVSLTLFDSTINAATTVAAGGAAASVVSAKVAALTEGVMKAMSMTKLTAVVAVALVLGFMVTGATVLSSRTAAAQGDKPPIAEERVRTPQKLDQGREKEPAFPEGTLTAAIKALNKRASEDQIGKDETPMTEQEVIAGIRASGRPKNAAVTDKLYDAFKKIAETRQLPRGAVLEEISGIWDPGTSFVYDVWRVRIEMTKEDGGTYSFQIRERIIRSRTLPEELARIEKALQDLPEQARQRPDGGRLQGRINDLKARIAKEKQGHPF